MTWKSLSAKLDKPWAISPYSTERFPFGEALFLSRKEKCNGRNVTTIKVNDFLKHP
jgi:hypothetical protein